MDDNKTNYLQFCSLKYAPGTVGQIRKTIEKLSAFEEFSGYSIQDFSEQQLTNMFRTISGTSYGDFSNKKHQIKEYIKWLGHSGIDTAKIDMLLNDINYKDAIPINEFDKYYWGSFRVLKETIDDFTIALQPPENSLDTCISIIYLAWHGIEQKDACKLLKRDLRDDRIINESIGINIIIEHAAMEYFTKYANSDYFECRKRGDTLHREFYKDTKYLLRTNICESMTPNRIRSTLSRFNNSIDMQGKRFQYDKIYWSGIFNRTYIEEVKTETSPQYITKTKVTKCEQIEKDREKKFYEDAFKLPESQTADLNKVISLYKKYKSVFFSAI